jgi:hypothetical protein
LVEFVAVIDPRLRLVEYGFAIGLAKRDEYLLTIHPHPDVAVFDGRANSGRNFVVNREIVGLSDARVCRPG